LFSSVRDARFLWEADPQKPVPAVMNIRDQQMADNLLWLASDRYAGRRIIVWAATSHASRNRHLIQRPIGDQGMVPMGDHLAKALGAQTYVIAFTSARGRFGSWRSTPADLALPRRGSVEDACLRTGAEALFLDLRGGVGPGDWLSKPVMARPMGHARMIARWPEVVDGFFFINTTHPSTEREP
jgi:erythromycin esterase